MKQRIAAMVVVILVGCVSMASAEMAFRLGGGVNSTSARAIEGVTFGVHGGLDFGLGNGPWTMGVFGEGNFDAQEGKPLLMGLSMFYKHSLGGRFSEGLDPKIYLGPSIGLVSVDLGQRETALHLGGTLGLEFPLSETVGLFGQAKYSWANNKNGVALHKGTSAHIGMTFRLGQ